MRYLLLLAWVPCLMSCNKLSDNEVKRVYYYNLDSLLHEQHQLLLSKKASLDKRAFVDGDTAATSYVPDSANWKDELAFFNKIDINKPVLQGAYRTEIVDDTRSNLKVKQFVPDNGKELEVQYLKIYYLDHIQNLKKIEASYQENNPIYKSTRHFEMQFDNIAGQVMLKGFTVQGGQKMILKDTVTFSAMGKVLWR